MIEKKERTPAPLNRFLLSNYIAFAAVSLDLAILLCLAIFTLCEVAP